MPVVGNLTGATVGNLAGVKPVTPAAGPFAGNPVVAAIAEQAATGGKGELITTPAAATGAALAIPAGLPSFLTTMPDVPSNIDDFGGEAGPYAALCTERSGKYQQLKSMGIPAGAWYVSVDGQPVPVVPFEFWMIDGATFSTQMASNGAITAASLDVTDRSNQKEEHVVALILVDVPNVGLVPVKADFRRTAAQPGAVGLRAIRDAADPQSDWSKDANNTAAKAFPLPWARAKMRTDPIPKVSRSTGNPYFMNPTVARATTMPEFQRIYDAISDPDFIARVQHAKSYYDSRVAELVKKAGGK